MSQAALEAYRQTGSGTTHERVREWSDSLGTYSSYPLTLFFRIGSN